MKEDRVLRVALFGCWDSDMVDVICVCEDDSNAIGMGGDISDVFIDVLIDFEIDGCRENCGG
jgi:hypothetical protein